MCRLEHEKLSNRKKDVIKKFVSSIKKNYDFIGVQDENIAAWKSSRMKGWGRIVHYSIMGGIICELKKLSQTRVVDKWEPTTQECLMCGKKTKYGLNERVFVCPFCGYTDDRDVHSARLVLKKAKQISTEYRNPMPVESESSTHEPVMADEQDSSMKQEAASFGMGSSRCDRNNRF